MLKHYIKKLYIYYASSGKDKPKDFLPVFIIITKHNKEELNIKRISGNTAIAEKQ